MDSIHLHIKIWCKLKCAIKKIFSAKIHKILIVFSCDTNKRFIYRKVD
jgi:hypothetical protein